MSKSKRRIVTGITIDNNSNELSIGHKKIREIKKNIYKLLKYEEKDSDEYIKKFQQIQGYLAYINDINKDLYFRLEKKFKTFDNSKSLFTKEKE